MQGGDGGASYQDNVLVLQGVQSWFTSNYGGCSIDASDSSSSCDGAGFDNVYAGSDGSVLARAVGYSCDITSDGTSYCMG